MITLPRFVDALTKRKGLYSQKAPEKILPLGYFVSKRIESDRGTSMELTTPSSTITYIVHSDNDVVQWEAALRLACSSLSPPPTKKSSKKSSASEDKIVTSQEKGVTSDKRSTSEEKGVTSEKKKSKKKKITSEKNTSEGESVDSEEKSSTSDKKSVTSEKKSVTSDKKSVTSDKKKSKKKKITPENTSEGESVTSDNKGVSSDKSIRSKKKKIAPKENVASSDSNQDRIPLTRRQSEPPRPKKKRTQTLDTNASGKREKRSDNEQSSTDKDSADSADSVDTADTADSPKTRTKNRSHSTVQQRRELPPLDLSGMRHPRSLRASYSTRVMPTQTRPSVTQLYPPRQLRRRGSLEQLWNTPRQEAQDKAAWAAFVRTLPQRPRTRERHQPNVQETAQGSLIVRALQRHASQRLTEQLSPPPPPPPPPSVKVSDT